VAINLIADPSWDRDRFRVIREWCQEIPEIVSISVNTPYPGTESWRTEARRISTRDYRLFDIQHAVLPTHLSLAEFYQELVETQRVLSIKHLGLSALREAAGLAVGRLLRGQTNFVRMLWNLTVSTTPSCRSLTITNQSATKFHLLRSGRKKLLEERSTCMERAGAKVARSTMKPRPLSKRPAWVPNRVRPRDVPRALRGTCRK
jgi:hypothetical protein